MVNEKSLANLEKGRKSKHKRKAASGGKTWADLIREIGEQPSTADPTKTNKQIVVEQAFRHAALGNAAILREIMQRSEPQGIDATGEIVFRVVYGKTARTDDTSTATT